MESKKKELDMELGDILDTALSRMRHVSCEDKEEASNLASDLLQMEIESDFAYYPLDVIELRYFIEQDSLSASCPAVLLSYKFIQKYCYDYPLIMCINIKGLDDRFGGALVDRNKLSLKQRLKRLYIFKDLNEETIDIINCIIKDTETKVDIIKDIKIPGVILDLEARSVSLVKTAQAPQSPQDPQATRDIHVDNDENTIFDFILNAKNHYPELKNVEIRVVGGWVRDKAMGKDSDDIDIAVSFNPDSPEAKEGKYISGFEFAKKISKYASRFNIAGVGDAYSVSLEKTASPSKNNVNAQGDGMSSSEQELKVGGIIIFGLKIEFVGLRTEVYNEESRKPIIAPTNQIMEDVIRRDLTINSMYYNIETRVVEDYAEGMQDIKDKVLRTPTDPSKTFIEDPLRMLRVLRFYSRLPDFKISPNILYIMEQSKNPESDFAVAYKTKIAPNRASKEIKKMMEGNNPVPATRLLLNTGFYNLVFDMPEDWHAITMDQQSPFHNLTLSEHTLKVLQELNDMAKKDGLSSKERGLLLISALLHDFGKMSPDIRVPKIDKSTNEPVKFDRDGEEVERRMYMGHAEKSSDFARNILENMGFTEEEKTFITSIVKSHMDPHHIEEALERYHNKDNNESKREKYFLSLKAMVGKFLAEIDSKLDDLQQAIDNIKRDSNVSEENRIAYIENLQKWIPIFDNAWKRIMEHGLADAIAKDHMTPEEIQDIKNSRNKTIDFIKEYRETMGNLTRKPISRQGVAVGNEIKRIMKEEIPGLPDNAMIRSGNKAVHYIKYIIDKIIEQQRLGFISTPEQMEEYIKANVKNWKNMIDQFNKKSNNWYKRIKTADASSGEDPSGFGFSGRDNESPLERAQEQIMHVNYNGVPMPFQKGDEVVLRFGGLGRGRMRGVVRSVEPNGIYIIEWMTGDYKGKIEHISVDEAQIKLDKA